MATNVIVPALGMAQETAVIIRWLKQEGETVTSGEPLVEIETDKARVEVEARASGILARVAAAVGAEIPVGQVIATILSLDEALPGTAAPDGAGHPAAAPASLPTELTPKRPVTQPSATKTAR